MSQPFGAVLKGRRKMRGIVGLAERTGLAQADHPPYKIASLLLYEGLEPSVEIISPQEGGGCG